VGGDAEDVYAAGGMLDDEVRIQPMQADGVELEQVAGQDRVRLCPEKLRPRGTCSAGAGSIPAACRSFQTVEAPTW
jgi:hypothetical protein